MGSPNQFQDFINTVHDAECSFYAMLLSGHGFCINEFAKYNVHDWEQQVQGELDKLKNKYDKIYLFGHSMGGLLALNASLNKDNKIAGVFLLSTPLKMNTFNLIFFIKKLKLLLYSKSHNVKATYMKSNSIDMSNVLLYPLIIKPTINFYKLLHKTKMNLEKISVPVCMVHSTNDETTSYKSAKLLYEGLCNTKREHITINKSWHAYFSEDEWSIVAQNLSDFIGA